MKRFVLGLLVSSCAPTEIDEGRFQSRAQTCYEYPADGDQRSFVSGTVRPMGCSADVIVVDDEAQTAEARTDAGSVSTVTHALNAGDGEPDAGSAISETLLSEPCRQLGVELEMDGADENGDVLINLFKAPHEDGGCQGEGCHAPGENAPNLVTDGVLERLVNGPLSDPDCREVGAGTVWVSPGAPEQSFLWWKLNTPYEMMMCGEPMPAFPAAPLPDVALQCVRAWIDGDTGG